MPVSNDPIRSQQVGGSNPLAGSIITRQEILSGRCLRLRVVAAHQVPESVKRRPY